MDLHSGEDLNAEEEEGYSSDATVPLGTPCADKSPLSLMVH